MIKRMARNNASILSTLTTDLVPGVSTARKVLTYDEAIAKVLRVALRLNEAENIGITLEDVAETVSIMFVVDGVDLLADGSCSVKLRARSEHGIIDMINNLL